MRAQFSKSIDFNQMLVFSVFGHLLILTFLLFLPKPPLEVKAFVPAFMVSLVESPSGNKHAVFIEIKPILSKFLLKKLLKEASKFTKCVFISFKHENIFKLLNIKKNTKVGLSFCPPTSVKKIIEKLNKKKINFLILDKSYIKNKKIQNLEITKYYYTIRTKSEFNKFKKNNNLIFENL